MKLYRFGSGSYLEDFVIMASTGDDALLKLKQHVKMPQYNSRYYELWKDATLDNLPLEYYFDEEEDVISIDNDY